MRGRISRRAGMAALAAALIAAPITAGALVHAGAVTTQASVGDETAFWEAWTDPDIVQIDLTADIDVHSGNGNGTCSPNSLPVRSSANAIVVDGHGFTLTQQCSPNAVLALEGDLTVQNVTITHEGSPDPTVTGNGILALEGDVVVLDSQIVGNWADADACPFEADAEVGTAALCNNAGGGIDAEDGNVRIERSTIANNRAYGVGGGVWADGTVTVIDSVVEDNHVDATDYFSSTPVAEGGGIAANIGLVAVGTTFRDNTAGCEAECYALGGGAAAGVSAQISGSTFTGNSAGCAALCINQGGGLWAVGGEVEVEGTTFEDNDVSCAEQCSAIGGGLDVGFPVEIDEAGLSALPTTFGVQPQDSATIVEIADSTFRNNTAGVALEDPASCFASSDFLGCTGGGLLVQMAESLTITGSTFDANAALLAGGAFATYQDVTTVELVNSTVTGNQSGQFAGAVAIAEGGVLTAVHDTIVGNELVEVAVDAVAASAFGPEAGAAAEVAEANLTAAGLTSFATVVALPIGGVNCDVFDSTTVSDGWNYSDDSTCGFTNAASGDLQDATDPMLNPLADNGGSTRTMLPFTPLSGGSASPLIDAIPVASCQTGAGAGVADDQRHVTRPQIVGCDIGAVEVTAEEYQVSPAELVVRFTG